MFLKSVYKYLFGIRFLILETTLQEKASENIKMNFLRLVPFLLAVAVGAPTEDTSKNDYISLI